MKSELNFPCCRERLEKGGEITVVAEGYCMSNQRKTPANTAQVFRLCASLNLCFCNDMLMVASKRISNIKKAGKWRCVDVRVGFRAFWDNAETCLNTTAYGRIEPE